MSRQCDKPDQFRGPCNWWEETVGCTPPMYPTPPPSGPGGPGGIVVGNAGPGGMVCTGVAADGTVYVGVNDPATGLCIPPGAASGLVHTYPACKDVVIPDSRGNPIGGFTCIRVAEGSQPPPGYEPF